MITGITGQDSRTSPSCARKATDVCAWCAAASVEKFERIEHYGGASGSTADLLDQLSLIRARQEFRPHDSTNVPPWRRIVRAQPRGPADADRELRRRRVTACSKPCGWSITTIRFYQASFERKCSGKRARGSATGNHTVPHRQPVRGRQGYGHFPSREVPRKLRHFACCGAIF